jgi:membrane protease YdiL (CAAX protease family)
LALALTIATYRWWSGGAVLALVPDRMTIYRFVMGLIIGGVIALAIMWCIGKYSDMRLHHNPVFNPLTFATGCLAIFLLAWAEELVFRGQVFSSLQKSTGPWSSLVFVTLAFVLYRVANGWVFQEALFGPGAWGLLFGLAALRTGGIAQSTGMQFAANLAQSIVGKTAFNWLSINQDPNSAGTMLEDIRRAGAWSQFIMFIAAILIVTWTLKRKREGKSI